MASKSIILILLVLPVLALADTTFVITDLKDFEIREVTSKTNYGAATGFSLDSVAGNEDRGIYWIEQLDTFSAFGTMRVKACTLVAVATLGNSGNIAAYLVNTSRTLQEGSNVTGSNHRLDGGGDWTCYKYPTIDAGEWSISFPHSYTQDTMTAIRNQGRNGTCGFFAAVRAAESAWMRANGHYLGAFNDADSAALDRSEPPCFQGEDSVAIRCIPLDGHDKKYNLKLDNSVMQVGDTICLMVRFFNDYEGPLVIDMSETDVYLNYCDLADDPKSDEVYTFHGDGGLMEFAILDEQNPETPFDLSGEDTIRMDGDYPVLLIRLVDFYDSLVACDIYKFKNTTRLILEADTVYAACSLAVYCCLKSEWNDPTWRYWDSNNNYRWKEWGGNATIIDISEQQILDCVGGALPASCFQFMMDSLTGFESWLPYTVYQNPSCEHATDGIQIEYWYRLPTDWDTILAYNYQFGAIAASASWPESLKFYDVNDTNLCYSEDDTVVHAMALTGHDSTYRNNELHVRFDNSWGTIWGQDGWGYVCISTLNAMSGWAFSAPVYTLPEGDSVLEWQTAGCDGANDREQTPFAMIAYTAGDSLKIPFDPDDVQDRIDNGGHLALLLVCQGTAAVNPKTSEGTPAAELRLNMYQPEVLLGSGVDIGKGVDIGR